MHCVIPAQAGIQAGFSDIRESGLDSRLRGNDGVDAESETHFYTIGMR